MDRIPNEILIEICRHLCPHCYKPTLEGQDVSNLVTQLFRGMAFDDLDLVKHFVFQNYYSKCLSPLQDALAKLCRVSKDISRLATPILYHCLSEARGTRFGAVRFLETIGNRPELATCVRSF